MDRGEVEMLSSLPQVTEPMSGRAEFQPRQVTSELPSHHPLDQVPVQQTS